MRDRKGLKKIRMVLNYRKSLVDHFPGVSIIDNSHDTATVVSIRLKDKETRDNLTIYYDRHWESSHYEFNDQGVVLGTQDGCEFAQPLIDSIFKMAELMDKKAKEEAAEREKERREKEEERRLKKLSKFKTVYEKLSKEYSYE